MSQGTEAVLKHRFATLKDAALLAELNHQLIRDEGHRNPMTVPQLAKRMKSWLRGEYRAVLFAQRRRIVAYALYRNDGDAVYLRQFFVGREHRRRGVGRRAMEILTREIIPRGTRLRLEVLVHNRAGHQFWKAVGFRDYAVTLEMIRA